LPVADSWAFTNCIKNASAKSKVYFFKCFMFFCSCYFLIN
jgi:hypothetical protein